MEDMTPEMLQATFDRAANEIQEYLNNGIVPKINYLNEERKKHQGTLQAHSDRLTEIVDEIESEIADIVNKLDCIIKDDGAAADSTWSSQKIRSSLNELLQKISDLNQGIADATEDIRYLEEENEGRISGILELQKEMENAQKTIDSVDGMYDGVMRHIIGLHTSVDALEEAAEKAVIDDNALSEESTWSSQKISQELGNAGGGGPAEGAVLYTEQNLTTDQQAQARANIGATDAAVIGDIETALDSIIAMQNELLGISTVTIYHSSNPDGEKSTYQYKPGMTWVVWVASEYNVDGYYVNGHGILCNSDGTYIGYGRLDEGEIVVAESLGASAIIDPNTYLYCYD